MLAHQTSLSVARTYIVWQHMFTADMDTQDLQRGSAEMILLSLLESRPRHGYELAKLVESQSDNLLQFNVASIYPMLYRLERKKLVEGRWVEKANERRRRFYRLTPLGRRTLADQRRTWQEFVKALNRITGFTHA
jgi:PadR family transcriptional regulator PadR